MRELSRNDCTNVSTITKAITSNRNAYKYLRTVWCAIAHEREPMKINGEDVIKVSTLYHDDRGSRRIDRYVLFRLTQMRFKTEQAVKE